jgi:hypothetical protein
MQKTYLRWSDKIWVRFPEARRRKHPLLANALGIVFEVFETEVEDRFLLIVDYRYVSGRPDSVRFLQEPWLGVPAFSPGKEAKEQSVEVMQCDSLPEREQAFMHLLHLLETYPRGQIDFGGGPIDFAGDGNDSPAPVPRKPVPPTRAAGQAQQHPVQDDSAE